MPLHRVYIGIGSNLGDRIAHLDEAVERLKRLQGVRVLKRSSNYLTKPEYVTEQPDFFNGAVEMETALTPADLLAALKAIEKDMGRVPTERRGPRVIDLDILLYDTEVVDEEDLQVPHSEMHRRMFVLEPLAEIAPDARHPVLGKTVRDLMRTIAKRNANGVTEC